MAYLTCTNLSVGYGSHPVATNINFSLSAGEMICVVGENGTGKSTLVKTLLGLQAPLAGTIELSDGIGRGELGYLPQQGGNKRDFPASAWEVALSGRLPRLGHRPFFSKADKQATDDALERVGALDLKNRPFDELSGGQRQRVLLARALCAEAKLIVLDEPTTGLDPTAAHTLYALLEELRGGGIAVIAVSHDVSEALWHSTHVLALGHTPPLFTTVNHYRAHVKGVHS
ncbi:MAG: ABC transporter ATP-binding protein [Atopobiaceae bacterium]|nr:ABC transporter ATP-binding protein [Atopobiaceae bacterium]